MDRGLVEMGFGGHQGGDPTALSMACPSQVVALLALQAMHGLLCMGVFTPTAQPL